MEIERTDKQLADYYQKLSEQKDRIIQELRVGAASRDERVRRYFDLVRYMRSELFEKELIDEDEYAELCIEGGKDGSMEGSVARLEGYDKIRAELADCKESLRWALNKGIGGYEEQSESYFREQLALAKQRAGLVAE